MDFKKKTVEEMLTWLEHKGYDEWIREVFEENEVDGRAFLLLTKNHMKELVTRIGPRVKLIEEQAKLRQLDSQVICNVAEYSCYEEIHDEDSDDNNDDDRLVDDDKDDHKLHNDNDDHKLYNENDDHKHDHQDDDDHKLYNDNDDHKLYCDNDHLRLYDDNDHHHKLYGGDDDHKLYQDHDDRLYDDNDDHNLYGDHHHKLHQDDNDNHKLGNHKDDYKVYDDDHKLDNDDDHKLDDKDGQGDKVDVSNIDVAEQIAMFCTDQNRDQQDHYKDEDQGGSVMPQSPVKDCERSSVYTPAQSNSSYMLSEDDDSVIFPSDMSADEDFNATDFPSPSDASSDEGRKQGNTKKLKKIPKKRRKASVDSDDLSDDYNENQMTNCTALSCGHKRVARKHQKAAVNLNSKRNTKGDRLLPDHHTIVGVKKPSKKLQKKNFISKKKTTRWSSLPIPFKLPKHFPKFVKKELSTGVLSGKARTRLVFIVAVAIFEHTPYPTKEEYDHVARQIVKKYEFMSDDKGSHEYIIKLLEDKLTYLRNCKTKQTYTYQPSRRRRCSMFTPKPPVLQSSAGSSSAAYEMYLKILRQQGERPNPDKAVVMDLMKKTFYMRRQNILKASTSVADLLKTFPCLRSHIQILAEFNRIMGRDMLAVYSEQWKTLMPNILAVAMKEKDNIPVQTAIKVAGHHLTDDHKSILALYCLCYLLREVGKKADHQHIITFIPEKANVRLAACDVITEEPTIVVRGNIAQLKDAYLVVEREVLCKLPNMLKVPLILLASYYVFNKTHIGPFSNLFVLMEYYLMRRSIPRKKTRVQLFLAQLAHVNDQN